MLTYSSANGWAPAAAAAAGKAAWYYGPSGTAPADVNPLPANGADAAGVYSNTISHNSDIYVNTVRVGTGNGNNGSNTVVGNNALSANTSGYQNTAVGQNTLAANISGIANTAIGGNALGVNTGGLNTALGYGALSAVTEGSGNIGIGVNTGGSITTGNNNIVISTVSGTVPNTPSISNQLNLGNAIFGINIDAGGAPANNLAKIGINTSAPVSALEVNGSATNTTALNVGDGLTAITVDFSQSNLAYYGTGSSTQPTTITVNNMKNGGTYSLLLKTQTSGVGYTFTGASSTGAALTFHNSVNVAATTTNWSLYTFIVMGNDVIYWMTTFNP